MSTKNDAKTPKKAPRMRTKARQAAKPLSTAPSLPGIQASPNLQATPDAQAGSVLPEGFPPVVVPAPACPSGKVFDLKAEQASRDEFIQRAKDKKNNLAKFDVGSEKRLAKYNAYVEQREAKINELGDEVQRLQGQIRGISDLRRNFDSKMKETEEEIDGYVKAKENAEFYLQIKKSIPLEKLPAEILVMILRLAFKEEEIIEFICFNEFVKFISHPLMQINSGVADRVAQVLLGENSFKVSNVWTAERIFSKNMPKLISRWIKRVDIPWPVHGYRMCKHLLSCENLQCLTLCSSFHEGSDPYYQSNTAFTKQMLAKLPTKCKVVIIDTYADHVYSTQEMKDSQEARRAEVQKLWDDRDGKPGPKKSRPRKKTSTPASGPADTNADASAEVEAQDPATTSSVPGDSGEVEAQVPAATSSVPDNTISELVPDDTSTGPSEEIALAPVQNESESELSDCENPFEDDDYAE